MAVMTALGAAAQWGFGWWAARRKERLEREDRRADERRADRKADEKTIVSHLEAVVARLESEVEETRAELKQCQNELIRVTAHVMYLEGQMEARGIPFRPLGPPSVPRAAGEAGPDAAAGANP